MKVTYVHRAGTHHASVSSGSSYGWSASVPITGWPGMGTFTSGNPFPPGMGVTGNPFPYPPSGSPSPFNTPERAESYLEGALLGLSFLSAALRVTRTSERTYNVRRHPFGHTVVQVEL